MKKRYKFTPNQWIIFDYQNGSVAIGYTKLDGLVPVIVFTSDEGNTGMIPYSEVVNPRRLYIESRETNNIRKSTDSLPDVMINFTKGEA